MNAMNGLRKCDDMITSAHLNIPPADPSFEFVLAKPAGKCAEKKNPNWRLSCLYVI